MPCLRPWMNAEMYCGTSRLLIRHHVRGTPVRSSTEIYFHFVNHRLYRPYIGLCLHTLPSDFNSNACSRLIMSIPTDERQPLLESSIDLKKQPPGPHDISRSNRIGILAGVWTATFLSVSFAHSLQTQVGLSNYHRPLTVRHRLFLKYRMPSHTIYPRNTCADECVGVSFFIFP